MDVSNSTGQSTEYRVTSPGSGGIPITGSPEAALSEARARADFREGRYETFGSAEDLVHSLMERVSKPRRAPVQIAQGKLVPHSRLSLATSRAKGMKVDFFIGGKLVASQTFSQAPTQVTLREEGGTYRIEVEADKQAGLAVG